MHFSLVFAYFTDGFEMLTQKNSSGSKINNATPTVVALIDTWVHRCVNLARTGGSLTLEARNSIFVISLQGPLANTIEDFWRMIWLEEVFSVVMLTKLKERKEVRW